jgi:hypothetical protein
VVVVAVVVVKPELTIGMGNQHKVALNRLKMKRCSLMEQERAQKRKEKRIEVTTMKKQQEDKR